MLLDMPSRFDLPSPQINGYKGKVAISRGPLMYCLEAWITLIWIYLIPGLIQIPCMLNPPLLC